MIPIFATIKTIFSLKRICPTCGKGHVAKPTQKTKTVACKSCKTSIPPPKKNK